MPNKTKALLADAARQQISRATQSCSVFRHRNIADACEEGAAPPLPAHSLWSRVKPYVTPNVLGKQMLLLLDLDESCRVTQETCQEDLLTGIAKLLLALKSYKDAVGKLPDSLDQLAPAYLSAVPIDPFDGKPMKYSAAKKILYSVGPDGIDSGGSNGEPWSAAPDPTFEIRF